ncbi:MAG: hypothetical protein ACRDMX_15465 [Solirubrobacteraceae bacterium]
MVVGLSSPSGDVTNVLAERWTGSKWSITPTPHIPDTLATTVFNAVSCPTSSLCMAVGYFDRNRTLYGLAEEWNGRRWSLRIPPNHSGTFPSQLEGVSCPSARMCLAVGFGGQRAFQKVVDRWNGHGWATSTSRPFSTGGAHPTDWGWNTVSCTAGDACMAVAGAWSGSFNGHRWTVRRIPGISSSNRIAEPPLNTVSCSSASSCMAVGQTYPSDFHNQPLAEYWNGRAWTKEQVPLPTPPSIPGSCAPNSPVPECTPPIQQPGATGGSLSSVSCPINDDCEAVGGSNEPTGPSIRNANAVAEQWNGTSWSLQSTIRALSVVSCTTGGVCEAVGGNPITPGRPATLVAERYG